MRDRLGDPLIHAAQTHARAMAEELRRSRPRLAEFVASGRLSVVAAYYDLETGAVEVLE